MSSGVIRLRGARQHNPKNLDLDPRTGEMAVVTGPSGSNRSSLVFDTLHAGGQRRYVETSSAYARQFLDRMDRPQVEHVEGVPPAIAIDQADPVHSSHSTVSMMTEPNDHLKLLFARAAQLFNRDTALPMRHDTPETIYNELLSRTCENDPCLIVTFPVKLPTNTSPEKVTQWLSVSGYTRVQAERVVESSTGKRKLPDVVANHFCLQGTERTRALKAVESSLKRGGRRVNAYVLPADGGAEPAIWHSSTGLHCPESDLRYADSQPTLFSLNSAYGMCDTCRSFGRVIGVDLELVTPDERKTLRDGAIKPMQTPAWKECQNDLMCYAAAADIPRSTPRVEITEAQRNWIINGNPAFKRGGWNRQWYGAHHFFDCLESKAYEVHIRVLLSRYRSYTTCETCSSARLKTGSMQWRLGTKENADAIPVPEHRFMPHGVTWSRTQLKILLGLTVRDLMLLPIERIRYFFDELTLPSTLLDGALELLLDEVRARLVYLCGVSIGYLTLNHQSHTLLDDEVQRIDLATALDASLVNTLFVLDGPSIGLHPRDLDRTVETMQRLRDAGNMLVVVEHDPSVVLVTDCLIDMGPGPGERGGNIVFDDTPASIRQADTLTGAYLSGRRRVADATGWQTCPAINAIPRLVLEDASKHNLHDIMVEIPLQRLMCVTGVSGSGRSTSIQDMLHPALAYHSGKATGSPGAFRTLRGTDQIDDVVFVDQSPIGKTARSNPTSYVDAFDEVRKLFVKTPVALQRGYTAGTFSFNSGDGHYPTYGGSGSEHVEVQFLSDIYLRYPDCDGTHYRAKILGVKIPHVGRPLLVANVLELTVSETASVFAGDADVLRVLQPIVNMGLEYVKLGQPVPTLSGGEAQRLKLTGFLAEVAQATQATTRKHIKQNVPANAGRLFMFDKPTTGPHFNDIAKLMQAFGKLLDAGHLLIVIEYDLDMVRAAGWIIDLGPEGDNADGLLVCAGMPAQVKDCAASHTDAALKQYEASAGKPEAIEGVPLQTTLIERRAKRATLVEVQGEDIVRIVRAHKRNLKGLNVNILHGKFNVVTGVSGSDKSTLVFGILFRKGRRHYLESLNAYVRSIVQLAGWPEVDAAYGIPPTVTIEQRLSRGDHKSVVATTSEVWYFLQLLYMRLSVQHCIHDGMPASTQSPEAVFAQLMHDHRGQHIGLLVSLVVNRKGIYTDLTKQAKTRGYTRLRVDDEFLSVDPWPRLDHFREHTLGLPVDDIVVSPGNEAVLRALLEQALKCGKGIMYVLVPLDGLQYVMHNGSTAHVDNVKVFSTKRTRSTCGTSYPELDPHMFPYNNKHGWYPSCVGTGLVLTREQHVASDDTVFGGDDRGRGQTLPPEEVDPEDMIDLPYPNCHGTHLNPTAHAVTFADKPIVDIAQWTVSQTRHWVEGLDLTGRDVNITRDVVTEIHSRLSFLGEVGLGYLSLDRAAPSLSGGEAQRIRPAMQLDSNLQGVCYVLDEPTIDLHPRDNQILLGTLRKLSDKGNTLVVVGHDEDMIRQAGHIIDIGPDAGKRGGIFIT